MVMPIDTKNNRAEEQLLSQLIFQRHLLSTAMCEQYKMQAAIFKQTLFQYLMQHQLIDPEIFLCACADFFNAKKINIDHKNINELATDKFPIQLIQNYFLLPVEKRENKITIAIANPEDIDIVNTLSFQLGLTVDMRFTRYDILCRLHNAFLSNKQYNNIQHQHEQLAQTIAHQFLSDAIHRDASDIHIEPYQQRLRIRFRIDGLLHEIISIPDHFTDAITSCIKVLSQIDIAIKRTPQDGRFTFRSYLGFLKDCRVSTCPTIHNEKIVIRLLNTDTQIRPIKTLGLSKKNEAIILDALQKPQGLILVTGPTGSGKTITLYTMLALLNQHHRNISTIEDPVEMQMEGINQTLVNTKTGLTFSQLLRALLRQDPDIIMIGEIRDSETAEMAIRAAQTGHLVLSTLHTNSASETITRLCHMGIAPYHLSAALTLVIAQRLMRKLCAHCQNGCTHCRDGFQGRIGVFEIMPISLAIKKLILNDASHLAIAAQNHRDGHFNLWKSALEMVENRITSLDEIYRVVPQDD